MATVLRKAICESPRDFTTYLTVYAFQLAIAFAYLPPVHGLCGIGIEPIGCISIGESVTVTCICQLEACTGTNSIHIMKNGEDVKHGDNNVTNYQDPCRTVYTFQADPTGDNHGAKFSCLVVFANKTTNESKPITLQMPVLQYDDQCTMPAKHNCTIEVSLVDGNGNVTDMSYVDCSSSIEPLPSSRSPMDTPVTSRDYWGESTESDTSGGVKQAVAHRRVLIGSVIAVCIITVIVVCIITVIVVYVSSLYCHNGQRRNCLHRQVSSPSLYESEEGVRSQQDLHVVLPDEEPALDHSRGLPSQRTEDSTSIQRLEQQDDEVEEPTLDNPRGLQSQQTEESTSIQSLEQQDDELRFDHAGNQQSQHTGDSTSTQGQEPKACTQQDEEPLPPHINGQAPVENCQLESEQAEDLREVPMHLETTDILPESIRREYMIAIENSKNSEKMEKQKFVLDARYRISQQLQTSLSPLTLLSTSAGSGVTHCTDESAGETVLTEGPATLDSESSIGIEITQFGASDHDPIPFRNT